MAQPYLHDHVACVAAPATWLSGPSGQLTGGADGLYVNDRRVLSRLVVTVDGREPVPVTARRAGASSAVFVGVLRELGDDGPDPTVTLTRRRLVEPNGGTETITLANASHQTLTVSLEVEASTDYAGMGAIKDGVAAAAEDGMTVSYESVPASPDFRWEVTIPPRESWSVELRFTRTDGPPVARSKRFSTLRVSADDRRLDALVRAGVQDLDALRLADGEDVYYTAGSPWYLTLFGRDSLWSARLGLPLGHDVAAGTLRALAKRQGVKHDPDTDEEPGKILHEVRPPDATYFLPPVYYGTVDATALFVSTLADAYRWGMSRLAVEALLDSVERAMEWLAGHDGFIAYQSSAKGLTNHGWKDSGDGVQHADGRLAAGPLALSEVQAYAYRAAVDAAWLLESFGREGGDRWRAWGADLAERFRAAFWCPGGYPAIALDGTGQQVDSIASNMGHLLGTGLLSAAESAAVAGRLAELRSPFGIRTVAPSSAGYNALSYHLGSVWPHDTAIALLGLVRDGHAGEAAAVIRALLDAGERFDYRLPELYGGDDLPTPYPASCRPQAWAAAAGPAILTALLGLDADVPGGRITFDPMTPSPVGAFRVRGLKIGEGELDVSVTAAGALTVHNGPVGVVFLMADGSPAAISKA
ncbi:glycogen debranching N-terminal domain-containing protein [Dactylosporangium sp. AC04546]|uniref:amylo-alpha-1,6-glucosidase n=1 Tax=Dactylosporangium sp. AC04546 TaxID=2862460 RepID=UPI001EDD0C8D|nr:glycogen debranching N-terminal domain-containing protein [Dactylosporangium sp. AC04546]WVK85189.1 glycogen debranching N-terminal domain-containing protein [Dactylosporangium sp. AC04546]